MNDSGVTKLGVAMLKGQRQKQIITFVEDKAKSKETFKRILKDGPYIAKKYQPQYIAGLIASLLFVLVPAFGLMSIDSSEIKPAIVLLVAICFLAFWIPLFTIIIHYWKKVEYGYNFQASSNGEWLKYDYNYTITRGAELEYMDTYKYSYYINLMSSSTTLSYDSQTNVITLTGTIYGNFDNYDSEHIYDISPLPENFDEDFEGYKIVSKIDIPNCFEPDLYQYLKSIVQKYSN